MNCPIEYFYLFCFEDVGVKTVSILNLFRCNCLFYCLLNCDVIVVIKKRDQSINLIVFKDPCEDPGEGVPAKKAMSFISLILKYIEVYNLETRLNSLNKNMMSYNSLESIPV